MRLFVRVWLVWFMVLALPVQGFAVAAMAHCGPPLLQAEAARAAAADAQAHAHHHAHQEHHGADAPAAADDEPMHHAATGDASTGDHQCSVCAACCLALALPATTARLQPPLIDPGFLRTAPPSLPSFVPTGLDRPPRAIPA